MKCVAKKQEGLSCEANAMLDDEFCYFHSQKISDSDRLSAQSRGGKANLVKVEHPLQPITIKKVGDVVVLLEETINLVRSGSLDIKAANCIGVLSGHILKALEVDTVASRVEIIERAILERRTRIS